jgi:hypothetical protein
VLFEFVLIRKEEVLVYVHNADMLDTLFLYNVRV